MASATNVYQRQQRSRDPQLSAEQKLYGPLQVTTAVTDFGQTSSSKSISAGFKLHW